MISVMTAYFAAFLMILYPALIIVIIRKINATDLDSYAVRDRYGVFFLGIDTYTIPKASYYLIFVVRRWILGLDIILL